MTTESLKHSSGNGQFVTIENLRLHYVSDGSGRPVVFLHGNAGFVQDFTTTIFPHLSKRYHTLAFDRPGHGLSARTRKQARTIEEQASLISKALQKLGIKRPLIVGHSWGGALALTFALHYPHEAAGLILLAPAAYQDGGSFLSAVMQTPMLGDIFTIISNPIIGRRFLRSNLARAFHPDPLPGEYLTTAQNSWLRRAQARAYAQDDYSLNASLRRLSAHYDQIRLPVEILTGDSDLIVPAEAHAYPLHRAIKHSRLTVLPKTGHQLPHTRPADIVKAIDAVWQRITH